MKYNKILTFFIAFCLAANSALALNVTKDGIIYKLDETSHTASVTGHTDDIAAEITILNKIHEGDIDYAVTKIDKSAFFGCTALTSVIIPEGIETIGGWAFCQCTSLISVTIPSSVTNIGSWAFGDVKNVINNSSCTDGEPWGALTLNGEVEGNYVYEANSNKTIISVYIGNESEVTIPEGITAIRYGAFAGVKNIINNSSCTEGEPWGALTVNGEHDGDFIYEPNTDKTILSAYIGNGGNVTIPDGVTIIDDEAFEYCTNLVSVTIPEGVEIIESWSFNGCTNLVSVSIPESVTIIGMEAFESCTNLVSVTIPQGISYINNYTFYGCESLQSVTIPEGVETIGEGAFGECSKLESVIISKGVTTIDDIAFVRCNNLTSVTIPESVTTIGEAAFEECYNLQMVTIPYGVTSIDEAAFRYCEALSSVTIPSSVTSIEYDAFFYCLGMEDVYCSANPELLSGVEYLPGYETSQEITYHVPEEYLEAWESINGFGNSISFVGDVKSIIGEGITIADIASQTYTGNTLTPVIEVKDGDKALVEGTDYTVIFPEDDLINAGNYTITIIGKKLYYESAEKTFTINKKALTTTNVADIASQTYDGSELIPSITVTDGANTLTEDEDYTVDGPNAIVKDAGSYTYTVRGKGNYSGDIEKTFTINKADPEEPENLVATQGQTLVDVELPEGWTWDDANTNVGNEIGDKTFPATYAGSDNYKNTTVDLTVTISRGTITRVDNVNANTTENDVWYDLTGRRLNGKPTTPGLYIHNGKKVLVK